MRHAPFISSNHNKLFVVLHLLHEFQLEEPKGCKRKILPDNDSNHYYYI